MGHGNPFERLQSMAAALVGVLFFFAIVGVFGLTWAIAGLAAFVFGVVIVCLAFPGQRAES